MIQLLLKIRLLFKQRIPRPDFRKAQIDEISAKYTFNNENNSYLSVSQVVKVEPTTTVVNPVNLSVNNLDRKPRVKLKRQRYYQGLF